MICYRDITMCTYMDCAKFGNCKYALNEKEKMQALEWWGKDDPPICTYSSKPDCYEEKKHDKA